MNDLVPKPTPLDKAEARKLADAIKVNVSLGWNAIRQARQDVLRLEAGRGWEALGYTSWADCVQKEFGWSRRSSYDVIKAAKVEAKLLCENRNCGEIPTSHLLAVADLPVNEAKKVIRKANKNPNKPATRKRIDELAAKAAAALQGKTSEQKKEIIEKAEEELEQRVKVRAKRDGLALLRRKAAKLTGKMRKLIAAAADRTDFPVEAGLRIVAEIDEVLDRDLEMQLERTDLLDKHWKGTRKRKAA